MSKDCQLSVSQIALSKSMLLKGQAVFPFSPRLVRFALAGLGSFLWHLLEQWAHGRQPMRRRSIPNPVPMGTQLGSGTVDLLNWRKMALYLASAHPCTRFKHGVNELISFLWRRKETTNNLHYSLIKHYHIRVTTLIGRTQESLYGRVLLSQLCCLSGHSLLYLCLLPVRLK